MLYVLSYLSLAFCLTTGGLLTADTVSSEKREGTLGLLFLTPLNGLDIVLGKMACHGLQLFYGLCAVAPAFFLPLLIGGVTGAEVSRVLLTLVLTLLLAASVGMLVSVLGFESKKTLMTVMVSLGLMAIVPPVLVQCLKTLELAGTMLDTVNLLSPAITIDAAFDSSYKNGAGSKIYWSSMTLMAVISLALIGIAGGSLSRVFRAMGLEAAVKRKLPARQPPGACEITGNPYEWLVLRGGSQGQALGLIGRLLMVVWVGLPMVFLLTKNYIPAFIAAFFAALAIHVFGKLRFAIEASHQIQSDRQSGGLELLLVSRLPERSIVEGHQHALRRLSRRPFTLMMAINLVLEFAMLAFPHALEMNVEAEWTFSAFFLGGIILARVDLAALRWLALWQGLQSGSHVRAVLVSLGLCLVVPWLAFGLILGPAMMGGMSQELATLLVFAWVGGSLVYDGLLAGYCQARLSLGIRHLVSEAPEHRSDRQQLWLAFWQALRRVVDPHTWPKLGWQLLGWLARPKIRRRLLVGAAAVVIVMAFYAEENRRGWQAWQNYQAVQNPSGFRIDPASPRASAVGDSQNIYMAPRMHRWFLEPGDNELTEGLNLGNLQVWLSQNQPLLKPDRAPSAQEYLTWSDRCRPEFELLRQALKRPLGRIPADARDLSGRPVLNVNTLLMLEKVLEQRISYHTQLGQSAEAWRDLALLHDLGRLQTTGSTDQPESLAMEFSFLSWAEMWSEAIGHGLQRHSWTTNELVLLQEQLRGTDLFSGMASAVASERGYACRSLEIATPARVLGVFGQQRSRTMIENIFSPQAQILALGPRGWIYQNMLFIAREYQVVSAGVDFTNRLVWPGRVAPSFQEIGSLSQYAFPYRCLGQAFLPNPEALARQLAQAQTQVNQAQVACALERFRLAQGSYPAELSSLTPRCLTSIPPDIIGGQPLKYRSGQQGYKLYSIGWNEVDDGGRNNTTSGAAFDDWVWQPGLSSPTKAAR